MTTDPSLRLRHSAVPHLSDALVDTACARVADFCQHHREEGAWLAQQLADSSFAAQLATVWSCSTFVHETCMISPGTFVELVTSGDLGTSYDDAGYSARLAARLAGTADEKQLQRVLRQFRRREMLRIVWRDFSRAAPLLETTGDVTRLAEACLQHSLEFLQPLVEQQLGTPVGAASGRPQRLVVLGMGKMGAWELNVSSDIDLIFAFPEGGETCGGRRQVSNQEFFIRLAQKLIQALDNNTADGFVFRVDMRLRPYGESGALVLNFDAMEEYYQTQGRDWERYAMIKARVVAGAREDGEALMAILRPFTYRRYIDFTAIQSLRDMKNLINREVARLGNADDVKKGAGGIREVEFIAQAFQLIRGGKDKRFQNPSLQAILGLLAEEQLLPAGEPELLWRAYEFLRNTEHVLQGAGDRQTQVLPEDSGGRAVVAAVMGYNSWQGFYRHLEDHRSAVQRVFAGIAAETSGEARPEPDQQAARALWLGTPDAESLGRELEALGYRDAAALAAQLHELREGRAVKGMSASVRDRLDTFMPLLITLCRERGDATGVLGRILPLVAAVLRRSAYLVLLIENREALRQLVYLCGESSWIASQIGRYPALLDELLDPRTLFTPQDKHSISQDLRQHLLRIPGEDLEAQMEALRYFRRAQALRIAACEVSGALPLMKVSDNLTWLAEAVLEQVQAIAWGWMVARHGRPGRGDPAQADPGLLVVGYGKLGGIELGHGSDLDLVFLHSADPNLASDGERSIDNNSFFLRLCQRMIHILTTHTASGDLYEVDPRLRPNGNSGLLVTSLAAFEKYQRDSAWTWEHQALARARAICGDADLAREFARVRHEILGLPRDPASLVADVVEMREKMRVHLGSKAGDGEGQFHLKQDAGGIVDVEFMVQYLVLRHAHQHPDLLEFTDNMRILDAIARNQLMAGEQVQTLQQAYVHYRGLGHRLSLQGAPAVVEVAQGSELDGYRQRVAAIWQQVMAPVAAS